MRINAIKKAYSFFRYLPKQGDIKKRFSYYNINGYRRIYHYHIRKTGGTSLNRMFLSLDKQYDEAIKLHQKIYKSPLHMANDGERNYVGFDRYLLERGDYFYGWSHLPFHSLYLPNNTYTFTIFRNPIDRIISHYKMLYEYKNDNIKHPCMQKEGRWLGSGFRDFIISAPAEHLMRQLYMFSKNFDKNEAIDNTSSLSQILFLETFARDVDILFKKLGLSNPAPFHERKGKIRPEIKEKDIELLKIKILPEVEFYEELLKHKFINTEIS